MLKTAFFSNIVNPRRQSSLPAKTLYKPSQSAFKSHVKPLYVWIGYALMAANVGLMFWYLLGVNSYAAQGYEISSLHRKIDQLADVNQKLTLKYSENSSLVAVQGDFAGSQFVPVVQANYVQVKQFSRR